MVFDPALLVRKRENFQNSDWRFANGKSRNSSKIVVFSQVSCTQWSACDHRNQASHSSGFRMRKSDKSSLWLQENSQWPERCQRCQSDDLEKALCCSCGTYLRNKATSSTNPFNLAFSDLVDSLLHPSLAPGALGVFDSVECSCYPAPLTSFDYNVPIMWPSAFKFGQDVFLLCLLLSPGKVSNCTRKQQHKVWKVTYWYICRYTNI